MGLFELLKKKLVPTDTQDKAEEKSDPKTNAEEDRKKEKAKIYNLIIVDESGSMGTLRRTTITGVNETISTIRSAQQEFAQTQQHYLTLVTFSSYGSYQNQIRTIIDHLPIQKVSKFADYCPNGCTPLYDAMGMSISNLYQYIKDDKNASAVVTVVTDGLENSSSEWTDNQVKALIERLKAEGWSFAYMGSAHDVKSVSDLLSIDHAMEFAHDKSAEGASWARECGARRGYYSKMNTLYETESILSEEDWLEIKRQYGREYYNQRDTPSRVTSLAPNEIFVFGSNLGGIHNGGAAAFAYKHFGAIWGQGEGLQGHSYAIPSVDGMDVLKNAVDRFTSFAREHPELKFLVTPVGCGVARLPIPSVARLFEKCVPLENVSLPEEFWKALGLKMY